MLEIIIFTNDLYYAVAHYRLKIKECIVNKKQCTLSCQKRKNFIQQACEFQKYKCATLGVAHLTNKQYSYFQNISGRARTPVHFLGYRSLVRREGFGHSHGYFYFLQKLSTYWVFYFAFLIKILNESCRSAPHFLTLHSKNIPFH